MKDLLEELSARVGCPYLSDLRLECWHPILKIVLKDIKPEKYPLQMWNDAFSYITGENQPCSNQRQAYERLLGFIGNPHEHIFR